MDIKNLARSMATDLSARLHQYKTAILTSHDEFEDAGRFAAEKVTMRDRINTRGGVNQAGYWDEDYVNGQEPVQASITVDVTNTIAGLLVDSGHSGKGFTMSDGRLIVTDADGTPIHEPRFLVKFEINAEE
jgi:hypothetical protein